MFLGNTLDDINKVHLNNKNADITHKYSYIKCKLALRFMLIGTTIKYAEI